MPTDEGRLSIAEMLMHRARKQAQQETRKIVLMEVIVTLQHMGVDLCEFHSHYAKVSQRRSVEWCEVGFPDETH